MNVISKISRIITVIFISYSATFATESEPRTPLQVANEMFQDGIKRINEGDFNNKALLHANLLAAKPIFAEAKHRYIAITMERDDPDSLTKLGIILQYGLDGTSPDYCNARIYYQRALWQCERRLSFDPSVFEELPNPASNIEGYQIAIQSYTIARTRYRDVIFQYPLAKLMLGILSFYASSNSELLNPCCITYKTESKAAWDQSESKIIKKPCCHPNCLTTHCLAYKGASSPSFFKESLSTVVTMPNRTMIDMVGDLLIHFDRQLALIFFYSANSHKNGMAIHKLAQLHVTGKGIIPDENIATKLFERALECGYRAPEAFGDEARKRQHDERPCSPTPLAPAPQEPVSSEEPSPTRSKRRVLDPEPCPPPAPPPIELDVPLLPEQIDRGLDPSTTVSGR